MSHDIWAPVCQGASESLCVQLGEASASDDSKSSAFWPLDETACLAQTKYCTSSATERPTVKHDDGVGVTLRGCWEEMNAGKHREKNGWSLQKPGNDLFSSWIMKHKAKAMQKCLKNSDIWESKVEFKQMNAGGWILTQLIISCLINRPICKNVSLWHERVFFCYSESKTPKFLVV